METGQYSRFSWREDALPLFAVVALAAIYLFSFFNRFAGLPSGNGEFGGGLGILSGLQPYRDYFTAGPPLNAYKSAVELALFGKTLIVSRACGVVERLLIGVALYFWLRRMFSVRAAMVASFATIIVCTGDYTDPIASYNHDSIFMAMLSGMAACLSIEKAGARACLLWSAAAGAAGGLSLLFKQTVGGASIVAVLVFGAIAVASGWSVKRGAAWVTAYALGVCIPVAALVFYLWRMDVLQSCLDMLFVKGPQAKASRPLMFLTREVAVAHYYLPAVGLAIFALGASSIAIIRGIWSPRQQPVRGRWNSLLLTAAFAAIVVMAELTSFKVPFLGRDLGVPSIYYTLFGVSLVGAGALASGLFRSGPDKIRLFQIAIMGAVSWAAAVALSLSWPAFEAMVLPGLGLLVAAIVDGGNVWIRRLSYAAVMLLVFSQVRQKLRSPFRFNDHADPPIQLSTVHSQQPAMRSMLLPPETARLIDDVCATVRSRTGSSDTIFTYPEMGLFYSVTNRRTPTRAGSHNIDVVSDDFARAEAARLLASPPAVVVYSRPKPSELAASEAAWRDGQPSGQRSIIAALDEIVSKYDVIGKYQLAPNEDPIIVFARPSPRQLTAHN